MLTIGTIVLGVNDVAAATKFWNDAISYVPREAGDETCDPCTVVGPGHGTVPHAQRNPGPGPPADPPGPVCGRPVRGGGAPGRARRTARGLGLVPGGPRLRGPGGSGREPVLRHRQESTVGPGPGIPGTSPVRGPLASVHVPHPDAVEPTEGISWSGLSGTEKSSPNPRTRWWWRETTISRATPSIPRICGTAARTPSARGRARPATTRWTLTA